jgi:hypothetical protein
MYKVRLWYSPTNLLISWNSETIFLIFQDMDYARRLMMLGLGQDDYGPIPKFPREKVYSWLKQFLQEEKSSIHYLLLFLLRALQYYSTQQQGVGSNQNLIPPLQSTLAWNITTSQGNQPPLSTLLTT